MMHDAAEIVRAIEQTGKAFVLADLSGTITYASPSMRELTGYGPDELVARNTRFFGIEGNSTAVIDELWETIVSKRVWTGILRNRRKNGTDYFEHVTITPVLDEDARICSFVAEKRDTAVPQLREAPVHPGQEAKIPTGSRLTIDFMSYEFRTSLNSILGFTQVLQEETQDSISETQSAYLGIISQSSHRLLHIIEDMLFLTQLEENEVSFHVQELVIARELKDIISNILTVSNTNHLRFIKVIEESGAQVCVDRRFFEKIVTNLLVNAIKFTGQGTITVGLEIRNGEAIVTVIDTGIGISDKFKSIIFMPYQQEELGYNQELEGAGIGLAITKKLTEMMSGTISFESVKNEGSTFSVRFPIVGWDESYEPAFAHAEVPIQHLDL